MTHQNLQIYLQDNQAMLLAGKGKVRILVEIAVQVANGMAYLESKSYVHGGMYRSKCHGNFLGHRIIPNLCMSFRADLAARNIHLDEHCRCKVSGFGLVPLLKWGGKKSWTKWSSPEIADTGKFSVKSDVWSFGIFLTELVTYGGTPYPGMTNAEVLEELLERAYRMPRMQEAPDFLYNMMLDCWRAVRTTGDPQEHSSHVVLQDPIARPTFETLQWRLDDYFVNEEVNYSYGFE
jgi:serine/threonine protein kinase